jgi:anaerobic magnesium-protoporphyrin IX monomethyl ester cyclase
LADILITHSYHLPYDPKQLRRMQPYPPLGMLYAATALREIGLSVVAFDSMLEEPAEGFRALLTAHRPGVVVVYEDDFNFLSKMCLTRMRDVAWQIARTAKASGAVTVVHGSDSTDNPALFLENGFDYVLCGEAEASLCSLSNSILRNEEISDIDGLVRLGPQGNIIRSKRHIASNPFWPKLSSPARNLIDLEPYRRAWKQAHGQFSLNIVASRGCPYKCNWCAKPISGSIFHLRSAAAVADEMLDLKRCARAEHIWFADDIFALDHRWVREFSDEVNKRDASLPFKIQSRANLMTDTTVEHLRRAGCQEVWMGVESGSQGVLDAMDKGLSISSIIVARERLKRAGIRACYFLQFGYPGEYWPELQQTIALVRETRPDDIGISFSYPLPGTAFYERVRMQLGEKRNWSDSGDLCIMFKAAYKTEFYRAVRDALHAEVESWRGSSQPEQTAASVAALWRVVDELEPVLRQKDTFSSNARENFVDVSALVSVDERHLPKEA